MVPDVYMENIGDNICQQLHYSIQTYHDKTSNIDVRILKINIFRQRKNSQMFMLDLPEFSGISIYTYQHEILSRFMLSYGIYITFLLNRVKVEEVDNIKC